MDLLLQALDFVRPALPVSVTIVFVVLGLFAAEHVLQRIGRNPAGKRFRNQLTMLGLSFAGTIMVILALPISETMRAQLLSLIGILLSAAIALSSTTLLGNAMAGIMLRAVKNFRSGDYIRCGNFEGRVSERGLFHTEIQTPDRELTTMPNLHLVTHPVTVVRSSGTIVSATVGLGYDVPRSKIEGALIAAAKQCALEDPFVQVLELGDFSISYRIAGLLTDVKSLISTRSRLRGATIDELHGAGIEIVSPNFMNTRAFDLDRRFIPARARAASATVEGAASVEEIVFDKAEEAESRESRFHRLDELDEQIDRGRKQIKEASDEAVREEHIAMVGKLELRRERLKKILEREAKEG